MARTRPSDILAALDRIYSHRERKEQLEQDRSFKMMEMNYRERAREDQQAFQKEVARDSRNRDFKTKYPGAIMQEDGYFGVPEGYDYTQSASFKSGQAINVEEDLRKFGLDTSGTSQERQNRLSVYQQAQGKGANMMQPTVSPDVAIRMGGDLTPNYFTQKDISDFQDFYDGSGGSDSPIALQQIVDAGIINADKLTLDPDTGLYQADDNAKALINVAFQGLKSGALKNESFMTNRQYEQYTEDIIGGIENFEVFMENIYLDDNEKQMFLNRELTYLIDLYHIGNTQRITNPNNRSTYTIDLEAKNPTKYIMWYLQREDVFKVNYYDNHGYDFPIKYSTSHYHTDDNKHIMKNATIVLNNSDINDNIDAIFLSDVEMYQKFGNSTEEIIYLFSFALHPRKPEPSGTVNLSRILYKSIKFTIKDEADITNDNTTSNILFNYYTCYNNILVIKDGLAGLMYQ